MKYYIIAGEPSGDLHASNLIKALKLEDPDADIRCWGGELSQQAGGTLVRHYRDIALMGFLEVVTHLGVILKALKFCKKDIAAWQPDVVILVDFAGFNMRIARWAKEHGFRTYYYIAPKVWAWNTGRVKSLKKYVDRIFSILPFEPAFFKKHDCEVDYVGNPVNDSVHQFRLNPDFRKKYGLSDKPIIAVLPGSRKQEIEHMLAYMVAVYPPFIRDYQFVIAAVPHFPAKYYENFKRHEDIHIITSDTYNILANATAAVVTSGTATLETAMFEVPQVVVYKGSAASYLIARAVVKVKYISLPNLIADAPVLKELIQDDFNPPNLLAELKRILTPEVQEFQKTKYQEIKSLLGHPGASNTTAKLMVKYLKESMASSKVS